jgi:hypothetical protein
MHDSVRHLSAAGQSSFNPANRQSNVCGWTARRGTVVVRMGDERRLSLDFYEHETSYAGFWAAVELASQIWAITRSCS